MILVAGRGYAQWAIPHKGNLVPKMSVYVDSFSIKFLKPSFFSAFIPHNLYSSRLGFICRQEIKMDRITKVQFRFRLGSVEQCDWLEGKRK